MTWAREDSDFEMMLSKYIVPIIDKYGRRESLMDLGCGDGTLLAHTRELNFSPIVGVDSSKEMIERAKINMSHALYIISPIERLIGNSSYDTVTMIGVLEHVYHPFTVLQIAKGQLHEHGRLIIVVPNAVSLNRRIGVEMGIIKHPFQLTHQDHEIGHKRFYTRFTLMKELIEVDLDIIATGGIMLKPLPISMMSGLSMGFYHALSVIGKELPDYCGMIYAVCEKKEE